MKKLNLGNIKLEVDIKSTESFYVSQNGFVCDCSDCASYVNNISQVQKSFNGLDKEIGVDLLKDVGQGMDELMAHYDDYNDRSIIVVPYYVVGKCYSENKELERQSAGPIWENTIHAKKNLANNLSLTIINTSGDIDIKGAKCVLTIWVEYKT